MEKAEADSILECDTGPIETRIEALAREPVLLTDALEMCELRMEETAPILRAAVERAAAGEALSDDAARLLLRGIFILGAERDEATFPILLRLLRRPAADVERWLGGALEIGLPKILSGTFDGDADALLALAADPSCLEAVRCSAMEAATFLAFDARIPRDTMRTLLADFAESRPAKGDLVWVMWSSAIGKLAFRDLGPLVEAALADERISKAVMRKRHFDNELAAAEANPGDPRPFEEASYIEDVMEALSRAGDATEEDGMLDAPSSTDMSIGWHTAALGKDLRLPEPALRACVARFGEAAPALRALLDRAAAGRPLAEEEELRLFRGLYLLAVARDTTACAPLLRLLRRPVEETEALLGDAITESLPRLLISLFDGDAEPLLDLATERSLDEYVRGAALEAAIYLTWEGRIGKVRFQDFLVRFHETRCADAGDYVWYSWMQAVALLDLRDLVPRVEAAWKANLIDHSFLEWDDFKMDLARAHTAYDDVGRFERARSGYADDIVAELEWTRHWGDEPAAGKTEPLARPSPKMPAVNLFRNVGRNDPCPCGSGRKYKKCCLAA